VTVRFRLYDRGVAASESAPSPNQLTVEQLAAESGMTVRNIRSHQARGLLAPPEVRARVGYYGPSHVEQLKLIRQLQDEGFNLNGIKRLLDEAEGTAESMLRFKERLTAPLHSEQAETLTVAEINERFKMAPQDAPQIIETVRRLGVLRPAGDGLLEAPSPALLAFADQVIARGISLKAALAVLETVEKHCDAVSRAFVQLFLHEVWKPFQEAGMPAERWPDIEESIERLKPTASEALIVIFQHAMTARIEAAFGEVTRRLERS
jgi:DNA-binding transcriptional MerR regulator